MGYMPVGAVRTRCSSPAHPLVHTRNDHATARLTPSNAAGACVQADQLLLLERRGGRSGGWTRRVGITIGECRSGAPRTVRTVSQFRSQRLHDRALDATLPATGASVQVDRPPLCERRGDRLRGWAPGMRISMAQCRSNAPSLALSSPRYRFRRPHDRATDVASRATGASVQVDRPPLCERRGDRLRGWARGMRISMVQCRSNAPSLAAWL